MSKISKIIESSFNGYDGIIVITETDTYKAGISNGQQCCEDWGYLFNEDGDAQSFVGANLLKVDCDGTFTRFFTDRGDFDFTAYNEHNGYYSHGTILMKNDEVIEQDWI